MRRVKLIAAMVAAVTMYALPARALPILAIQPTTQSLIAGQTSSAAITISGAADLYAFQFDLGFNPAVLSVNSIAEGPLLTGGGVTFFVPGTIDNGAGTVSATADTLLSAIVGINGSGTLATLNFTALSSGTSAINLFGATLLDSSLAGQAFTTQSGTIAVTNVPEPSTLLLIGTGLTVLARRRLTRA